MSVDTGKAAGEQVAIPSGAEGTEAAASARVRIQKGFRWNACDAYLFDIDGTLMRAQGGVHYDAFSSSVLAIMGFPVSLEGVSVHGGTDTGILRDAFRNSAIADEVWQPRLEEILEQMRATVTNRRTEMRLVVLPGVVQILSYLKNMGKLLGLATGNLEQIGWLKVEQAGLREWFTFGGFSDRHVARSELVGHALKQARLLAGQEATVCVVGDTPADIAAAKANSLPAIAVATGIYSYDKLLEHSPEVCASTFKALLEDGDSPCSHGERQGESPNIKPNGYGT